MEFTRDGTFSDPAAYLAQLPSLATSLPAGARAFATDPEHYNFWGKRCIKDLKPQHLTFGEANGIPWAELHLKHNCWKHEDDLTIRYTGVQDVAMDPPGEVSEVADLGGVMLDEILPVEHGCTHEFTCLSGSLIITCEDLVVTWTDSNCPERNP
ncbi:hypothetical protein GCM10009745_09470 [Kribbella yunnanensis]|uniref:Uncharacterized protein n=1 Tax=Kribbella yunnanensis TaxID=190194 RepID=A0ABN2GCP2_9ACTN